MSEIGSGYMVHMIIVVIGLHSLHSSNHKSHKCWDDQMCVAGVEIKGEQFFSIINFCEQMTLKKFCYASKILLYK